MVHRPVHARARRRGPPAGPRRLRNLGARPAPEPGRAEVPTPAAVVKRPSSGGRTASAYWHFSKAQMEAREGRLQDAVSELRLAIKDDPNTAALWVQLSQWLAPHRGRDGRDRGRPERHRARCHQRVRPSGPGRPVPAPAAPGRRRARARAGHRARPRGAGRVPRARSAVRRAEELRQGARGPRAADQRAAQSRPGALPARTGRHRDRAVGRGDRRAQARDGDRCGPRRLVVGPRLRLREPQPTRRGHQPLQGRDQGEPGQPGLRGTARATCSSVSAGSRRRRPSSSSSSSRSPATRASG